MHELLNKVKKELDNIAEKGITSSNLESTYKLIDIYKDIKEAKYYEKMLGNECDSVEDTDFPDERTKRYMNRMKDGITNYTNGWKKYSDGGANDRMVEGIDMTMCAIVDFIEALMDIAHTSQEKEIVRRNIEKIKRI